MSKLEMAYTIGLAALVTIVILYFLVLAIKNGWIKKLTQTLNEAIRYADKNIVGPTEKKKYVMETVANKCTELGIPYFLIEKLISKLIEKIIYHHNIIDHDEK